MRPVSSYLRGYPHVTDSSATKPRHPREIVESREAFGATRQKYNTLPHDQHKLARYLVRGLTRLRPIIRDTWSASPFTISQNSMLTPPPPVNSTIAPTPNPRAAASGRCTSGLSDSYVSDVWPCISDGPCTADDRLYLTHVTEWTIQHFGAEYVLVPNIVTIVPK